MNYMRIKFDSDNNLPLNKVLKFNAVIILLEMFLKKMVNTIPKFF